MTPLPADYYATEEPCGCPACSDGGTESDTNTETWRGKAFEDVREVVLKAQNHRCAGCGLSHKEHRERDDLWPEDGGLHVHHITEIWEFDHPEEAHTEENCVALCASCHNDRHPWDITHGERIGAERTNTNRIQK